MNLTFHGGAMEVGRSCISVDGRYLLDCGLKISEEGSEYPVMLDKSRVSAVFVSHAHLDHTGALPLFDQNGLRASIFCNSMTREMAKILLKDSLHVELLENREAGYKKENIYNILGSMQMVRYDRPVQAGDCRATFIYAGHIPGSSSILLEYNGMRILYTGDINYQDTHLLKGASLDVKGVDVLISESTYGDRNHPPREKAEAEFLDKVEETLSRGGRVLIPAFAVGRSQEILMMLATRQIRAPIFLDGMAKRVTNTYMRRPDCVKDHRKLSKAVRGVRYIKSRSERKEAERSQGVFVTTSGMLDGGPVIDFLGSMYHDEKSSVLLTGYQAEETNGRLLQEEGKVYLDGIRTKVQCEVKKFDFSAHSGQNELLQMVRHLKPRNLILQHGDPDAIEALSRMVKIDCRIIKPRLGESVEIRGD
jgi:putative mRNA 3-end processing factor